MAGPVLSALKYLIISYKKAASERKPGEQSKPDTRTRTTRSARDAALPHQRQAGPRARWWQKVQALCCQQKAREEVGPALRDIRYFCSRRARALLSPCFPPRASAGVFLFQGILVSSMVPHSTCPTPSPPCRGGVSFLQHSKDGKFSLHVNFPFEVIYMFYI